MTGDFAERTNVIEHSHQWACKGYSHLSLERFRRAVFANRPQKTRRCLQVCGTTHITSCSSRQYNRKRAGIDALVRGSSTRFFSSQDLGWNGVCLEFHDLPKSGISFGSKNVAMMPSSVQIDSPLFTHRENSVRSS
jgi:hypothetical protein